MSLNKDNPWVGNVYKENRKVTYDGINYEKEATQLLWGSYYFLDDKRVEHYREVETILGVLSRFGGFQTSLMLLLSPFAIMANRE